MVAGVVGPGAVGAAPGIGVVVVVDEVVDEVVIGESAPGVVVFGVVVVGAGPGAVGAALGMGWMGVTRLVMASKLSSTASSCSRRRSRRAASTWWTSAYVAMNLQLSVGLSGLQVVCEGCHELVTLRERRVGLLRSFPDEDLHPCKGASSLGVGGTVQLIHGIAGDVCDGVHAQDRGTKALERIGSAEGVWLRIGSGRVLGARMVRHRRSQARSWSSRVPSQAPSGLRSARMGLRLRQ